MQKGEERKLDILLHAYRIASVSGLRGLTIGSLAKAVGMSKSGLFAHFKSKEKLQLATLSWISSRFIQDVLKPVIKVERGEPRLRALFKTWITWLHDLSLPGGCVIIGAVSEFDDEPGAVQDLLRTTQSQLMDSICRMVRGAIEEGHFRSSLEPEQFAYQLYSMMLGYHHFSRLLKDKNALTRLENSFENLLLQCSPHYGENHAY